MITTDQMSYEDMKNTVDAGYSCGQCGGRLSVAWGGSFGVNGYILRCLKDIEHDTINRHDVEREKKIQQIKEIRNLDSVSLTKMSETQMIERIGKAKFPNELSQSEKKTLAALAISYGFDPLLGEITIYQGRPYITVDARYRKAQETNLLDGVSTRPATKIERELWQIPDGDLFFHSDIWKKGCSHSFEGWGRVRASEMKPGSSKQGDTTSMYKPIQNNPQIMGAKRSEANGLKKGFHIPLPFGNFEDLGTPDDDVPSNYIEAEIVDDMPEGLRAPTQADKDFNDMESASSKEPEPVKTKIDKDLKALIDKIVNDSAKMGYTTKQVSDLIAIKFGPGLKTIDLTKKQASDLIDMIAKGEGLSE